MRDSATQPVCNALLPRSNAISFLIPFLIPWSQPWRNIYGLPIGCSVEGKFFVDEFRELNGSETLVGTRQKIMYSHSHKI